jgi:hypothetical protein
MIQIYFLHFIKAISKYNEVFLSKSHCIFNFAKESTGRRFTASTYFFHQIHFFASFSKKKGTGFSKKKYPENWQNVLH